MSEQVKEVQGDQSMGRPAGIAQNLEVMEQSLYIFLRAMKNLGTQICALNQPLRG